MGTGGQGGSFEGPMAQCGPHLCPIYPPSIFDPNPITQPVASQARLAALEGGEVAALVANEGLKKQRRDIEKKLNVQVWRLGRWEVTRPRFKEKGGRM